jgi:hypothetical protein
MASVGPITSMILQVHQYPDEGWFDNSPDTRTFLRVISNECDSAVDLLIGRVNVLSGYEGSFAYPSYALLRSFASSVCLFRTQSTARCPIYLQQYDFGQDAPQHTLELTALSHPNCLRATFHWCPFVEQPPQQVFPVSGQLSLADLRADIERETKNYRSRILHLAERFGIDLGEVDSLLQPFALVC